MKTAMTRIQVANAMMNYGVISTPEEYLSIVSEKPLPVSYWLNLSIITESQKEMYPNAKIAAEIKSSPLGKALE